MCKCGLVWKQSIDKVMPVQKYDSFYIAIPIYIPISEWTKNKISHSPFYQGQEKGADGYYSLEYFIQG